MTMKRYTTLAAVLFALIAAWYNGPCLAQITARTSEELAREIAPLISENTICVAHVDFAAFAPEQMAGNLKELCNAIRNAAAFDEQLAKEMNAKLPPDEIFDDLPKEAIEMLKWVREDCGVTDFYYLVSFPFQDCVAVPIREGVKTEFFDERAFVRFKDFMLFPNMRNFRNDSNQKGQVDRMFVTGFASTERPEILEGLKLAGNRPVRAVAFWPSYAKMLLTQMVPTLPEPFDTISSEQIFDGLQLVAAGFDPNSIRAELIIQSKDQTSAEALHTFILSMPEKFMPLVETNSEIHFLAVSVLLFGNALKDNADFLLPPPQNGMITVRLPGENFASNMQSLFESIVEHSKKGILGKATITMNCANNIKMMMLAMHNHHDACHYFPQAYTVDAAGKPLHSWRVALLPFLEQQPLYEQIRRDEPWDSEWNKQFHDKCPKFYQCSEMSDEEKASGMTSYSFVVGSRCYPKPGKQQYQFSQITDGTSNTIGIVERQTPVNWMDPTAELTQEQVFLGPTNPESGIGLRHDRDGKRSFNVGYFDGSVRVIGDDIPLETWKALLTRSGGESVSYP